MVVGSLGNKSPGSNRFILVTPKSENDVRLQATLGNQTPRACLWEQSAFHIEEARSETSFADEVYTGVSFNVELMNKLANPDVHAAYINKNKELVYLIDSEYQEQWQHWKIGVHWWGVTYKLDSDFGKLVGIGSMVYRLATYVYDAFSFYKNIMNQTDDDKVTSVISTAVFYLPANAINDTVSTYLSKHIELLVSGLISANIALMTLEASSFGLAWVVKTVLRAILDNIAPTLITSCTLIYNCFRFDSCVYCQIRWWGINWSLTQLN